MTIIYRLFLFLKQKTAYEMRIRDGSSDVCSYDLGLPPADRAAHQRGGHHRPPEAEGRGGAPGDPLGGNAPAAQPGQTRCHPPEAADPAAYNLVCLAMQEPQYAVHAIWTLMVRVAEAQVPCLSIMNMPQLTYLKSIPGLEEAKLNGAH